MVKAKNSMNPLFCVGFYIGLFVGVFFSYFSFAIVYDMAETGNYFNLALFIPFIVLFAFGFLGWAIEKFIIKRF